MGVLKNGILVIFVITSALFWMSFINKNHIEVVSELLLDFKCAVENFTEKWILFDQETSKLSKKMPSIVHDPTTPFQKATFGMGCFWANDALFGAQPGVLRTRVGYAGGTTPNPVYKKMGDHTEVVEIDFDPQIISYEDLLELFWANHEYGYTTFIKRQYMSLILYHDEKQKRIAEKSIKIEAGKNNDKVHTEVGQAKIFYPAEDYHQKYRLQKHPWILEELQITPELLQRSQIAAKLNGYFAGVGTPENFEKDMKKLGIPEKIASYVRSHFQENEGGSLYC